MSVGRSFLFVPGDSEKKVAKALGAEADALILDLEDSVSSERKNTARGLIAEVLKTAETRPSQLWVRINPLTTPDALRDLVAIAAGDPDGIVLPKCDSAADLETLDRLLGDLEVAAARPRGSVRVMPIATETPKSIFGLQTYREGAPRLAALTWGAEDLPTALGASLNSRNGMPTDICRLARTLCLVAAAAAAVPAIETVYTAIHDLAGLKAYAQAGKEEGFSGMMAIHPAHIPTINAVFTPSAAEIAWARHIVESFARAPATGVIAIDGIMHDAPHLKRAHRILVHAGR